MAADGLGGDPAAHPCAAAAAAAAHHRPPQAPWLLAQPRRGACCVAGSDEVVFPKDGTVSAEARELLLGLLQKNPERRLSLQAVLDHPWTKRHTAAASA